MQNTLIAYTSKYGGTKTCAEKIAKRLPGQTTLLDLDTTAAVDLTPYDSVVIGCSVYMGKPRKAAKKFCEQYRDALLERNVGLFLCCIQDLDKTVAQQFELAFPKTMMAHATVLGTLGGVVDFTKLKLFDRFIMNIVAGDLRKKLGGDLVSTLSDERINRFSELLAAGKQAAQPQAVVSPPQKK
ncbi:flavodoxin domain-containing protein [Eubacteriales bacterium OttesenSCG-928-A19]|nr:flavodoxin domain-containing protein [Eubacteriales bacterium OttesenSCG-928-A19]